MPVTDVSDDENSNIIDLTTRREQAKEQGLLPEPNGYWGRRKHGVSLMLAERTVENIAPAHIMTGFMHQQFLRPWTMHGDAQKMWAIFALNQTKMPLSLGLDFYGELCHVEISCTAERYIHAVPIDNPWAVLPHLESVTYPEIDAQLGKLAGNYFYWFMYAYRQTLAHLANEFGFYAEVKKRCLVPPELLAERTPKKALLRG